MKTLLELDAACFVLGLASFLRVLYVRTFYVHSPEQALGEALNPINILAVLGQFIFGVLFLIFALTTIVFYFYERRISTQGGPCA
jgi:hypothetical protein